MRKFDISALVFAFSVSVSTSATGQVCSMKIDFENPSTSQSWRTVNDGVMGGQSLGGPSFENGIMVFEGRINTDGGGFSSVRTDVDPGSLGDASGLNLRVKSDGRSYKVTLRTDARYRNRPIAFQVEIPPSKIGQWENVRVPFEGLKASLFGRRVIGAKFDKTQVNEIGIILADGQDGPFRLEIDTIESC